MDRNRWIERAHPAAILSLGFLLAGTIGAQPESSATGPASTLTDLGSYLARAQEANPQLEAFKQRYRAAMERVPQASALPDPTFQVTHFVESVQTRTGPQENAFVLSQRIPWFGKLSSREQAASAEEEALRFAYQNQQLMLARKVSSAFFDYCYTREALRLTRENLDLLRKLEPIVEEKVRSGDDINALLRLKVEIGKVDDGLQSLSRNRIAQSAALGELLALPESILLPWPEWQAPSRIEPDGLSLSAAIRANNPELKMLKHKIASAEARRQVARLENYPDFTLGINYIQTGDPVVNPNTPDAGTDPWGVTVAVNIPIWFGKYNAAKAEALANRRSFESEYQQRLNALLAELSSSLASLEDANRRLALYGDELLGLAKQAVDNSRASYESGRTGILEVIDSERSMLDLQLLYWRAAADAWQQRVVIHTLADRPILAASQTEANNE